jgi:hypothetical protein
MRISSISSLYLMGLNMNRPVKSAKLADAIHWLEKVVFDDFKGRGGTRKSASTFLMYFRRKLMSMFS